MRHFSTASRNIIGNIYLEPQKVRVPAEPLNEDFSQVELLFDQALSVPPGEREAFLQQRCADNPALMARLQDLLNAYEDELQASEVQRVSQSAKNAFQQRRLGPYQLESLLGRGGMGAVYLARRADGQYEKKVAIKVVDLPLATEVFYERFRQERQILAGLDHPHIARLLDGGVSEDGILFLVMEYVEGVRIDEYCRTHAMALEEKLRLFISVCGAVQFAHQSLVIHRDLKPDNVLVSKDGNPHLLDFGTAKLMTDDGASDTRGLTREGFLSFTPAYASPEQVLGRTITTSSDTYSLGVLLYQILTGRPPYELNAFTAEEMIRVICEQPINPPTSADETFPDPDLEAILAKALRKEPELRYQTADGFAADVQAYLNHQPVTARKGNLRYRTVKFVRRNRLAISFAVILAITLAAGVVAVAWQAHTALLAERASETSAKDLSQLSDTLLTELDDAIKQLPGSTGVQQILVGQVLDHLDRTSQHTHGDVLTQISLANAFVRLANLQGSPYEQNLGDVPGALHSLDRATAILMPLTNTPSADASALLALARAQDSKGEILSFAEDNTNAVASLEASVKTFEHLLATPSASPTLVFEAGSVIDTLGDVMGQDTGFADANAALLNYRRAIDFDQRALTMDPNFKPARRGLATMQMKVGNVELDAEPAAALNDFKGALTRLDALPPEDQSRLDLTRLRALILRKQAFSLGELGEFAEAKPLYDQSSAIYHRIAAADPKDLRALRDLDRLLTNETFTYESAAIPGLAESKNLNLHSLPDPEELEAERASALTKILQVRPRDAAVAQELAAVQVRSDVLHQGKHPADPAMLLRDREALSLLRSSAATDKASTMELDLAFHAFTEATPDALRDLSFARHCAEQGTSLTHRRAPSWLLSLAQAYRATGDNVRAQQAAKEGLALLPNTPDNQHFRLTKLLLAESQ